MKIKVSEVFEIGGNGIFFLFCCVDIAGWVACMPAFLFLLHALEFVSVVKLHFNNLSEHHYYQNSWLTMKMECWVLWHSSSLALLKVKASERRTIPNKIHTWSTFNYHYFLLYYWSTIGSNCTIEFQSCELCIHQVFQQHDLKSPSHI